MTVRNIPRVTRPSLVVSLCALVAVLAVGLAADALVPRPVSAQRSSSAAGRGFLGVSLQDLNDDLRDSYDYRGDGALVSDVSNGSPAEEVGIREGDILMKIGEHQVEGVRDATDYVRSLEPGAKVSITVFRGGNARSLGQATIADYDAARDRDEERATPRAPRTPRPPRVYAPRVHPAPGVHAFSFGRGRLGVQTHDLDADLGAYFKAPGNRGALVLDVIDDSPAAKAGIKSGDVIVKVAGVEIADTDDLRKELRKREAGSVALEILRNGQRRTINAQLEEAGSLDLFKWDGDGRMGYHLGDGDFDFHFDGDDGDGKEIRRHVFRVGPQSFDFDDWDELSPEERARFKERMEKLRDDMRDLRKELREMRDDDDDR